MSARLPVDLFDPFRPAARRAGPLRAGVPAAVAALALALAGCGAGGAEPEGSGGSAAAAEGCVESYDPGTDYFPDKSELRHASNFTIEYESSYQVVTVNEPFPGGAPETYVLVRCGTPAPELEGELAQAPQIEVPVTSVYAASTPPLPALVELGSLDALTGVAAGAYVSDPQVRERLDAGELAEFAPTGQTDTDAVVEAAPEVLLSAGVEDPGYSVLRDAGVPVLAHAEYLEQNPLGRAEWIKFTAALTGTEAQAAEIFDAVEAEYQETAALVADAEPVQALPGQMFEGVWTVPQGDSYMGRLIQDAGGSYAWADTEGTGNVELDLEEVLTGAQDAEVWLATANEWTSLADVSAADERYAEFAAFESGEVWSSNRALNATGGNDVFERGSVHPEVLLADLVSILHPDVLPEHEPQFYQRLSE
ncbi:ABC transporter substrate-binding protein [Allonocardiopsis opalescens]|uniref:Iron complex transport system substrate-binding protein n=1 Tax=Allonocardiopsis opalescens TaxID=1144618 RepID=A0A2T0QDX6_9ACTN|nr:ABC transporter substrate-binding protein [Allonocardiopsis opalescens]PRY02146.1 iron complex transport system substrate-binding protein [Allonocardiopsis opalescens]